MHTTAGDLDILRQAVTSVTSRNHLTPTQMQEVVDILMSCDLETEPYGLLASALLSGLKTKGETVEEIVGAALALRRCQVDVTSKTSEGPVIDTCGTGGDGAHLINISTITGIVLSSLGITVAKHGNRSVSSACGSADLLEQMGYPLLSSPEVVSRCVEETGFGFLFAPHFHPALKNLAGLRRSLGIRTVFNMLGPLVNPIHVTHQMIGVFDRAIVGPMAQAASLLGLQRVLVVHGEGGLDELSPLGRSWVAVCDGDDFREEVWTPEHFGAPPVALRHLAGGGPAENAALCARLLAGELPEAACAIAMNCAAGLWLVGKADDLKDGYRQALEAILDGTAGRHFERAKDFAQTLSR